LGKKLDPKHPQYLITGDKYYMQFEANYLEALMVAHPDCLHRAKLNYSDDLVADGLQGGSGICWIISTNK